MRKGGGERHCREYLTPKLRRDSGSILLRGSPGLRRLSLEGAVEP